MGEEWREVEWRIPVVGSPAFFADADRFDPSEAFLCEVIVLRGKVRGPDARGEYEVRVYEGELVATVVLSDAMVTQYRGGPTNTDERALYLAASVLRSPKAAHRERLNRLGDAHRTLAPLLAATPEGGD